MNYPVWEVGIGLPMLIAIMANVHVFVAHFAIGGGLFLILTETYARKSNDTEMLGYIEKHGRFFILLTLVFGAITGVGIWFTIGLIHPAATSSLIRLFVWFWAIEWITFFVEITAAMIYYHSWKKMKASHHLAIGWIYFISGWMSLFIINGIITFMLTPGQWLETNNILHAFFNPTYIPSLTARTLMAVLFAGLFAFFTASNLQNLQLKKRVMRLATAYALPTVLLLLPTLLWYYNTLPGNVLTTLEGHWVALANTKSAILWSSALIFVGIILSPMLRPTKVTVAESFVLLLLGLTLISSFEWFRESARKPYVLAGYMYSNEIVKNDLAEAKATGLTEFANWMRTNSEHYGEDLTKAACLRCHSIDGYNSMTKRIHLNGWTEEEYAELIPRTEHFRGAMPPFIGNVEEATEIAKYLYSKVDKAKIVRSKEPEAIFQRNCNLCHSIDYFKKNKTFDGNNFEEIKEIILITGDMMDEMPHFMGDDNDAEKLAKYLHEQLNSNPKEVSK